MFGIFGAVGIIQHHNAVILDNRGGKVKPFAAQFNGFAVDIIRQGGEPAPGQLVHGAISGGGRAHQVGAICDGIKAAWYLNRNDVRESGERFGCVDAQIDAYESALADCMRGEWW